MITMKLFVSYARDDKPWVNEFCTALRDTAQHEVLIENENVPAADWWLTILDNIEACECFVYVISEKSLRSIYCNAELDYALALNQPILPLMLQGCPYPPKLEGHPSQ